jgi:hypothetical protein
MKKNKFTIKSILPLMVLTLLVLSSFTKSENTISERQSFKVVVKYKSGSFAEGIKANYRECHYTDGETYYFTID